MQLRPRLVFAFRNLFEVIDGVVPMDLYGEVGNSFDCVDGVWGNNSLRGYTLHAPRAAQNARVSSVTAYVAGSRPFPSAWSARAP